MAFKLRYMHTWCCVLLHTQAQVARVNAWHELFFPCDRRNFSDKTKMRQYVLILAPVAGWVLRLVPLPVYQFSLISSHQALTVTMWCAAL